MTPARHSIFFPLIAKAGPPSSLYPGCAPDEEVVRIKFPSSFSTSNSVDVNFPLRTIDSSIDSPAPKIVSLSPFLRCLFLHGEILLLEKPFGILSNARSSKELK